MKISTKGRYALRMMIDLAQNSANGFVPLKEISERQGISKKYMELIVSSMHNSDLLTAGRGFQGGYQLAKSPDQITVGEILRLTEGSMAPVACLEWDPVGCERRNDCPTLFIWRELDRRINEYLDSVTLQDILDRNSSEYDYMI
ncbi:MAG: Rrf2 family transcriptional regulator [Clostridia bacterium]|nr:Rrf2 family transcriptional regulator [Clostridia bacterium]